MKSLIKVLSLGAAVLLSAPFAKADSTNQISFAGAETYCPAANSGGGCTTAGAVNYADATPNVPGNVITVGATGIFTDFNFGYTTFNNFNYLMPNTPFVLFSSIDANNAAETLSFTVTQLGYFFNTANDLTVVGSGNYILTNGNTSTTYTNGNFNMTTQGGGGSVVSFSDTNTITPEPSSLILLGTGLVGAAGILLRRRRGAGAGSMVIA